MNRLMFCAICVLAAPPALAQSAAPTARANFINAQGQPVGKATLTQTPNGVLISAELAGLPPGEHAFHIHEVGQCDPATAFDSAKGHYDPRGHKHGFTVEGGPHAGDMPNQFVGQDGKLRLDAFNPNVTLGSGQATVFDQDGSALVIHANADDYRSQPSGNAGGRIACAVIEKQ